MRDERPVRCALLLLAGCAQDAALARDAGLRPCPVDFPLGEQQVVGATRFSVTATVGQNGCSGPIANGYAFVYAHDAVTGLSMRVLLLSGTRTVELGSVDLPPGQMSAQFSFSVPCEPTTLSSASCTEVGPYVAR